MQVKAAANRGLRLSSLATSTHDAKHKNTANLHVAEELGGAEGNGDGEERLRIPRGDVELQGAGAVGLIQQIHRPQQRALLRQVAVGAVDGRDLRYGGGPEGNAYAYVVEFHGPDLGQDKPSSILRYICRRGKEARGVGGARNALLAITAVSSGRRKKGVTVIFTPPASRWSQMRTTEVV